MKKFLLILALLAYAAVSCDKPENISVDEPETEAPAVEDKSADTCSIYFYSVFPIPVICQAYKHSSAEIDFDASVMSMFRHCCLTLKNGDYTIAIGSNIDYSHTATFDTGTIYGLYNKTIVDSLEYGNYVVVLCDATLGSEWGPNCYNEKQAFVFHEITFSEYHTADTFNYDDILIQFIRDATPLTFTEF